MKFKFNFKRVLGLSFLFISIFYSSCQFGHIKQVTGSYYLVAVKEGADMNLSFKNKDSTFTTIISPTVFAVGFNDEYIIAKRHPKDESNEDNDERIEYYILPILNEIDYPMLEGLVEPLNKTEFQNQRKKLGIAYSLTFTIEYGLLK